MADNRVKRIRQTSLIQSGDPQGEPQKCGRQAIVPKQEVAVPMCSPAFVVARFYRTPLRQARFQIVPERRLLKGLLLLVPAHVVVPPSPLEQSSGWPLPTRRGRPHAKFKLRARAPAHASAPRHRRTGHQNAKILAWKIALNRRAWVNGSATSSWP